jgi:hypothetical protein
MAPRPLDEPHQNAVKVMDFGLAKQRHEGATVGITAATVRHEREGGSTMRCQIEQDSVHACSANLCYKRAESALLDNSKQMKGG